VYFNVKGKGNENVKSLTKGRAVRYTERHSDKSVCAESVNPIAGVCVRARIHVSLKGKGIESQRARAHMQTYAYAFNLHLTQAEVLLALLVLLLASLWMRSSSPLFEFMHALCIRPSALFDSSFFLNPR
jgi:hypothetical protein